MLVSSSSNSSSKLSQSSNLQFQLSPLAKAVRASVFGIGMSVVASSAHAATMVVTSNTDNASMCTLREAIIAINAGSNGNGCSNTSGNAFGTSDTILFSSTGSIVLGLDGELVVEKDVVIDASNVGGVTIDANQNSRVMNIDESLSVTLDNLTITGGSTGYDGGGIFGGEQTSITILDSTITSNTGGSYGGGIFIGAYSELDVQDSDFTDNYSESDGGAIYAEYSGNSSGYQSSTITLTNATISGNTAYGDEGGGIWSYGSNHVVELTNTVVSGNTSGSQGGGIYVSGYYGHQLRITGGSITDNYAYFEGGGLQISGSADFELNDVMITGNSTSGDGGGIFIQVYDSSNYGGISSQGTLSNVTINSNFADQEGGGLFVGGEGLELTIQRSSVSDNYADGEGGGIKIYNSSSTQDILVDLQITTVTGNSSNNSGGGINIVSISDGVTTLRMMDSEVSDNELNIYSVNNGGGIAAYDATLQIESSNISNNQNGYFGGGIVAFESTVGIKETTISGNTAIADGGGIYTNDTDLFVVKSTISGNSAGTSSYQEGGGIWSSGGYVDINNSTLSGNSSYSEGGGIWSGAYETTIRNSTVSDNSGGGYFSNYGGIYSVGLMTLENSIVANSTGSDCGGYVVSDESSIIEDGSCATLARSGDPGLMSLASNGAPTKTHALEANSIARDTGILATCLLRDQRNLLRDDGDGACDVGAYEFDISGFIVIPLSNGNVIVVPN